MKDASYVTMGIHRFVFAFVFCALAGSGARASEQHEIVVEVSNPRNDKGEMCMALFRDGKGYPSDLQNAVIRECVPVSSMPWRVRAEPGDYAVAILHDEDGDRLMTSRLMGIPKEGYGFSNDPSAKLGPPAWKKAAFTLDADKRLAVRLIYW